MQASPAVAVAAYAVDEGGMGTRGQLIVDSEPRRFPDLVRVKAVSPEYFSAMGLTIVDGRGLNRRDTAAAAPAAIASASLASLLARAAL